MKVRTFVSSFFYVPKFLYVGIFLILGHIIEILVNVDREKHFFPKIFLFNKKALPLHQKQ